MVKRFSISCYVRECEFGSSSMWKSIEFQMFLIWSIFKRIMKGILFVKNFAILV
jgi:hypothetical protein